MKNLDDKERKLAELLEELNFEINTDQVWSEIEGRLPSKRRSRALFWWLGSFSAILISGLLLSIVTGADKEDMQIEVEEVSMHEDSDDVFGKSQALEAAIDEVYQRRENETSEHPSMLSDNVTADEPVTFRARINTSRRSSITASPINQRNLSVAEYAKSSTLTFGLSSNLTSPSLGLDNSPIGVIKVGAEKLNSISFLNGISVINHDSRPIPGYTTALAKILVHHEKQPLKFISIGVGANTHGLSYADVSDLALSQNLSYEGSSPGLSLEALVGRTSQKGFSVMMGLNYSQLVNRYENNDFHTQEQVVTGTTGSYINALGETINYTGPVTTTIQSDFDIRWYRQHHTLDLVLGVGQEFSLGGDWSLRADAGLRYNLMTLTAGYAFSEGQIGISTFDSSQNTFFKNSFGLGYFYGVALEKRIADSYAISLSPYRSGYVNKINTDGSSDINSSHFGMRLGVKRFMR